MKAKMMKMARGRTLISKLGYIVVFRKNRPVSVPAMVIEEAMTLGAGFCEEDEEFVIEEELTPVEKPLFGPERKEMLLKVCTELKEKNDIDDFTATGAPKLKVVNEQAGFDIDRKELNSIWMELLQKAE